ncbi:TlpA family protein disulfide reductase [Psychroflexus tropicus]|uniref:TlpA family protein disulfide reductase n=1 Tax=Psychroflexus tropicus TaxID=197345 RepID=UPI00035CF39E|nr:redoxin domain-containing protein [Psychroflexus tropicus]
MRYCFLLITFLSFQINLAQEYPETLPDFNLITLEEDAFTREEVKENDYSYFIYFSPTCGHCIDAFKFLNLKATQVEKANVQVYPVSTNTKELTLNFFDKHASKIFDLENVFVTRDEGFRFADLMNVVSFPTSFLYDSNGKLIKAYEGEAEILLFLNDIK